MTATEAERPEGPPPGAWPDEGKVSPQWLRRVGILCAVPTYPAR